MRGRARLIGALVLVAVGLGSWRLALHHATAPLPLHPASSGPAARSERSAASPVAGIADGARRERAAATGGHTDATTHGATSPATSVASGVELRVARDGSPAAGTLVTLYRDEDGSAALLFEAIRGSAAAVARTSPAGAVSFSDLRPGRYVAAVGEAVEPVCRLAFVVLEGEHPPGLRSSMPRGSSSPVRVSSSTTATAPATATSAARCRPGPTRCASRPVRAVCSGSRRSAVTWSST